VGGPDGALYSANTPAAFWRFLAEPSASDWTAAVAAAAQQLPAAVRAGGDGIGSLLQRSLGEGQFGDRHWTIGSALRLYYAVKPVLPRSSTRWLRRLRSTSAGSFPLRWPIEDRYARFQWELAGEVIRRQGRTSIPFTHFWPGGHRYAFVLTHDVETAAGHDRVLDLADLDAKYGFRSSFNFVPERYAIDRRLLDELRGRGFEIGIHGLKHDGKLFSSFPEFMRRAQRINRYLREFDAVGFRAPLTHRNPDWMQALEIDYDLSFFDTDPYEPIPGGTMSLWPFMIGRFVELPYTLLQDYTLTGVLGETTPRLWLEKVDAIKEYCGMALLNAHPDYLVNGTTLRVYEAFLAAMRERAGYWHALPREVARWWRLRSSPSSLAGQSEVEALVELTSDGVRITESTGSRTTAHRARR
jgi:peptidoglycan/xylan/chitin deacetylase (PgdA/CDA1 family)